MLQKIVVMGVSGSGKSTFGRVLAEAMQASFIEGDDHHLPESRDKMRRGIALTDADREPWLDMLAARLSDTQGQVVLACSVLKRSYRDRLRERVQGLVFVFLEIAQADALTRVAGRAGHYFPATLVANQFDTLESPAGEAYVLCLQATDDVEQNRQVALRWLDTIRGLA